MITIEGGYKTLRVFEISNLIESLKAKRISLRTSQLFFSAVALIATYEAHKRSRTKNFRRAGEITQFSISKLSELSGLSEGAVKCELRKLKKLGLITIEKGEIRISQEVEESETLALLSGGRSIKRPVPIPRYVLRFLAKAQTKSMVLTTLAYMVRGLTITRVGEIKTSGTVKASWISEVTDLSIRSVKASRAKLIAVEIISKDESSTQVKLNRTGSYFSVITVRKAVDKSDSARVIFAPPIVKNSPEFAPPYKDKKTPYGSKNQKSTSGFLIKRVGEGERKPTINNIVIEDLQSFYRTEELYFQAVKANWINDSENSFLDFLAAAIRAKSQKDADQVRLFVAIVKKKLFHFITNEQEERARKGIQKFRYGAELPEEMRRLVA
jgi:hypothetical protein